METQTEDPTYAAYELLAPFYDSYTREYGHELWLENLEAIAIGHGLRGNRLLDVGCGTGKSFLPMLARGYEVTGCDISPAMVERARSASGGAAGGGGGGRRGGGGRSRPARARPLRPRHEPRRRPQLRAERRGARDDVRRRG